MIGFIYARAAAPLVIGIVCVACGLTGMWLFLIITEPIMSGFTTTFVCLAMDPYALEARQPELFRKVCETYPTISYDYGLRVGV